MALSIQNNIASLIAQTNLNKSSSALNQSLQRLSSGLKINTGADGPAALVISNEQGAQIAGLQSAIDNTNQAVSLAQTGEGALAEVNNLLVQVRGLALSAANSAVNDPTSLAADQAQIQNALSTIDRIASNTQFGTRKLLDGSAGVSVSVQPPTGSTVNQLVYTGTSSAAPAGNYAVNITTQGAKAQVLTSATAVGTTLAGNQTLTVNGVSVGLGSGSNKSQVIAAVNQVTNQTGVAADELVTQAKTLAFTSTSGPVTAGSDLTFVSGITGHTGGTIQVGDIINYSGVDSNGKAYSGSFTYAAGNSLTTLAAAINTTVGAGGTVSVDASGNQIDIAGAAGQGTSVSLKLSSSTGGGTSVTLSGNPATPAQSTQSEVRLLSTNYGSAAKIALATTADQGLGFVATAAGGVSGTDVAGTINGQTGVGAGNTLSGPTGSTLSTLQVTINPLNGNNALNTATGNVGGFTLTNNALTFQIGANAGQTATLSINDSHTNQLGTGVANASGFLNLGQINVTTAQGAQDALGLIDSAINQISSLRGNLGAFQTNTLQATATNLQTTLTNITAAQSVIRDTDFAAETANFTKSQVLVQAGTTVLTNSNAQSQLILNLLK